MALNASMVWRIRAGGSNNNGAGYDAAVSGAGTDYTDQDSAQLALTDLATSGAGSTTLTSVTGGFTSAMIGNTIKIRSGTNFQTGYYMITGRTDTNTVTLDRTPTSGGAGSAGSGNVGGASATLLNYTSAGTAGTPSVTSPLAAGHTIYLRGAGSDDPSSDDYTNTGYMQFAAGSAAAGMIKLIGYNGRPRISSDGLTFYLLSYWLIKGIKSKPTGTSNASLGVFNGLSGLVDLDDVVVDQNGQDIAGATTVGHIHKCRFYNTGSTTAGTYAAITQGGYGSRVFGCVIDKWRGYGVEMDEMGSVEFTIVANTKKTGVGAIQNGETNDAYRNAILNCTIYNNAADGIKITHASAVVGTQIKNNIIANNAAYGLNYSVGSTALNDRAVRIAPNYNDFYSNTSGARQNISAGANDSTLDPTFTDSANGDFSIGTNLKALGYPGAFPGGTSTGYLDMGAVQRQEAGGSVSSVEVHNSMVIVPMGVVGY